MDISSMGGLNANAFTDFTLNQASNTAANAAKKAAEGTGKDSTDKELMDACKQFESYFLEQIFKEMEKSVDAMKSTKEDQSTSNLVNYYKDKTLADIASQSTELQGTGLAQQLYENLKRNYPST